MISFGVTNFEVGVVGHFSCDPFSCDTLPMKTGEVRSSELLGGPNKLLSSLEKTLFLRKYNSSKRRFPEIKIRLFTKS